LPSQQFTTPLTVVRPGENAPVDLNQLRAFLCVARTGQLARAADGLHLTQSAVSRQIKALEDALGLRLFARTAQGMALSAEGQRLLPLAETTVASAQALAVLAATMRGAVSGVLRLGTIVDPESIRLGPLLAMLVERHPQVDVRLRHGISGVVLRLLLAGEVDAAFFLGPLQHPDVAVHPLALEHYVVVGPVAWQAALHRADWADLAAMPWLATPAGSSQHGLVAQMFAERGLTHRTVVQADQEAAMAELVQTGVALGLMRERLAADAARQGRVVIWPGARLPCPLSLLVRRADAASSLLPRLLDALKAVWAADGPAA
jgi:DNA-binding transcriptional LysR family regulator